MLREAPRGEIKSMLRHLKSLPSDSIKLWLMGHCSSVISPQGISLQRENYRGLGHAVEHFIQRLRAALTVAPLLNYDHRHVFNFRSMLSKEVRLQNIDQKSLAKILCSCGPTRFSFFMYSRTGRRLWTYTSTYQSNPQIPLSHHL